MNASEQLVVLCMEHGANCLLEQTIEAQGYEVRYVSSMDDVLNAPEPESSASVALVVNAGTVSRVDVLLREAAERMPLAKVLVCVPEGHEQLGELAGERAGSDRILWITGGTGSPENVRRIRRFLQGEGYRWASDLRPAGTGGVFLFDAATSSGGRGQDETRKLVAAVSDLSRFTELGPMLQEALHKYLDLLQCEAGSIYLWEESSETLILKAAEGPEQDQRLGLRQKLGEGLAGWVAEVGEPILVTDTRKVHKLRGRVCRRYSDFSCLAMPVVHGGQILGVVCLTMRKDNKLFEPDDLHLAQALSQKLGSLVGHLRLLVESRSFNERLLGVYRSWSDLVAQKDAQMEAMRALSADILGGIPLGVIAYDRDLHVRFSNAAAQGLFGVDSVGQSSGDGFSLGNGLEVAPEVWREKLLSTVERGLEFRLHRVTHRSEDQTHVLDIHCSPLHDPDGVAIGGILTVQDVTEDVEMEAKLSSAERLALIGKIVAKVAHELNNPLDGIMRFLNLAIRQVHDQPEKAQEHLEESRRGILRMTNVLAQLLAFSRGHVGSGRPVSLSEVIRDALSLYEERAHAANIQICMDIPPDLPPCNGADLCEVFSNVVKNALSAMDHDGVLTVRAMREGEGVRVAVSDTGPGVRGDLREKIFEPFFTTKKDGSGTGLGLAACRDSLNRIGGSIRLCPSDGGATFEIMVPVDNEEE